MAHLYVVFDPTVPQEERFRLLTECKVTFIPSDGEVASYLVEVPAGKQLEKAQEIAELAYDDRPAITYVEFTRPVREVLESTSH